MGFLIEKFNGPGVNKAEALKKIFVLREGVSCREVFIRVWASNTDDMASRRAVRYIQTNHCNQIA